MQRETHFGATSSLALGRGPMWREGARACARVRAWCVRAGVPGLQPNIAAARSPYGNMNASGVCSAGRRVARPPYLTVSSYCFRSGRGGETEKKRFKKDTSGHTTVRAAHPPPFACSPHLVCFMGFGVCQEWRLRNGSEWSHGREGEIMTTGNGRE